jgi:hypothetical protein
VAHRDYVFDLEPKLQNINWGDLFSDYPKSYQRAVNAAEAGISRLSETNEFAVHFVPSYGNERRRKKVRHASLIPYRTDQLCRCDPG